MNLQTESERKRMLEIQKEREIAKVGRTPEFLALMDIMRRRESLYELGRDLSRQEVITQKFLKHFLQEMLSAWMDLEEKTELALKARDNTKLIEMCADAANRADLAKQCTEMFMQEVILLKEGRGE